MARSLTVKSRKMGALDGVGPGVGAVLSVARKAKKSKKAKNFIKPSKAEREAKNKKASDEDIEAGKKEGSKSFYDGKIGPTRKAKSEATPRGRSNKDVIDGAGKLLKKKVKLK